MFKRIFANIKSNGTVNVNGKIEAGNCVTVKGCHTRGKINASNSIRVGYNSPTSTSGEQFTKEGI